ncbi:hypothetical protein M378DRAFT_296350 [Amanita muscaria Koide BX008]|uniref:Secreted protein n=1 Tax=Amanita muscaria (strain Koide BX008) TaxID=946122 RepID=A0A0C2SUS6_AMAMK|nr:hypothetical protein M378DRAFT_296350 [Amanita muscaria Koide BX008]
MFLKLCWLVGALHILSCPSTGFRFIRGLLPPRVSPARTPTAIRAAGSTRAPGISSSSPSGLVGAAVGTSTLGTVLDLTLFFGGIVASRRRLGDQTSFYAVVDDLFVGFRIDLRSVKNMWRSSVSRTSHT